MLLFSHVKILCFRARPHLVFHCSLYKKKYSTTTTLIPSLFHPLYDAWSCTLVLAAILVVAYRALHASHTRQTRQNNHFCHKGNQHLSFKFSALRNFS